MIKIKHCHGYFYKLHLWFCWKFKKINVDCQIDKMIFLDVKNISFLKRKLLKIFWKIFLLLASCLVYILLAHEIIQSINGIINLTWFSCNNNKLYSQKEGFVMRGILSNPILTNRIINSNIYSSYIRA